jgi:hypothetical protein
VNPELIFNLDETANNDWAAKGIVFASVVYHGTRSDAQRSPHLKSTDKGIAL